MSGTHDVDGAAIGADEGGCDPEAEAGPRNRRLVALAAERPAAELRPFAIVMHEDMYAFDSKEFDALARDVRAALIVVDDEAGGAGIARGIDQPLEEAFSQRSR